MTIESLQSLCKKFPSVTEDVKWGNDLCFCIGEKMFLVIGLNQNPASASFKVLDEEFDELSNRAGFMPAPYVARYKWVLVKDINTLGKKDWEHYAKQSYKLVSDKLPKKIKDKLK